MVLETPYSMQTTRIYDWANHGGQMIQNPGTGIGSYIQTTLAYALHTKRLVEETVLSCFGSQSGDGRRSQMTDILGRQVSESTGEDANPLTMNKMIH
ncbi:hypothetical protein PT974_05601 [Cladobotryum mycophilum]|uniref:Uncharacterized protein n=1 Tax=Cladobotryum mycophilum TaxID=491253 RepID=A0ABR0SJ88_9HYPO